MKYMFLPRLRYFEFSRVIYCTADGEQAKRVALATAEKTRLFNRR